MIKKLLLSILLIGLLAGYSDAQPDWQLTSLSVDANGAFALDETTAFVGVTFDTVLQMTENNGDTWQEIPLVANGYFGSGLQDFQFSFLDELEGWLVVTTFNSRAFTFKTMDGGHTWTHLSTPMNGNVGDIHFIDQNVGFATNGWIREVWKTTDGGFTWDSEMFATSSGAYPNDIQFIDVNNGWITGYQCVFRTTDGGQNWTEYSNWLALKGTHFFDAQNGIASTFDYGKLFTTNDAGQTWALSYEDTILPEMYDLTFTDNLTGYWAGGQECRYGTCHGEPFILKTTDGGNTWLTQTHDAAATNILFNDLTFTPSGNGWITSENGPLKMELSPDAVPEIAGSEFQINPSRGLLTIRIKNSNLMHGVRLLSVSGDVIAVVNQFSGSATVETSGLAAGIYLVQCWDVASRESYAAQKVVIVD
jgi:photosystem II stability/assembly factor-like uncharacterized protein